MVGMMGAGKTAVGTAVARMLGVPFTDSDDAIVEAANMTIAEIFERDGEPFFREKERQVINRLLNAPPQILSTGGGAFLAPENRALIAEHARPCGCGRTWIFFGRGCGTRRRGPCCERRNPMKR